MVRRTVLLSISLATSICLLQAGICADYIKIFSIGAVLAGDTPIIEILEPEPAVRMALLPTRRASEMEPETARRYVRLYFPKTYDDLRSYDMILYVAAPDVRPLTTGQIQLLRRATEEGVPAFADQGGISGYESFEDAWMASGLHEIFPNDAPAVVQHGVEHTLGLNTFTIAINRDDSLPRVLSPFIDLGVERYVVSHGFYVVPRQGAISWGDMKGAFPEKGTSTPWLMSIDYEGTLTWNMGDNFVSSFWGSRFGEMRNPYRTDILMNVILHSVGRELPLDILEVHNQREAFGRFIQQRRFLLEVIDFAEDFGANVGGLYESLREVDAAVDHAKSAYLDQDYEESGSLMADVFDSLENLNAEAFDAKDRALAWVFASEWMAITGTSIVTGWVLHFLMVKRRLYSESGRTSFRDSS
ncbi:MAG: hypothetical protein HXS50_05485 [Theionarchaea archaeon]|nr:hypothetical protein [Theionarchaea archaeon]